MEGVAEMMAMTLVNSRGKFVRGFTLIEVMVTVAIVGILAAVAIPAYSSYVIKGHRSNAKAILMESAQFMERYYTTNNAYTNAALLSTVVPKGATGGGIKYNITFSVVPSATGYTLQAEPTSAQAVDVCGTLTLSSTGAQTPTTAGCW
jgi:type IV pilus assembly protein PilE